MQSAHFMIELQNSHCFGGDNVMPSVRQPSLPADGANLTVALVCFQKLHCKKIKGYKECPYTYSSNNRRLQ